MYPEAEAGSDAEWGTEDGGVTGSNGTEYQEAGGWCIGWLRPKSSETERGGHWAI